MSGGTAPALVRPQQKRLLDRQAQRRVRDV